jgi:hypothetical protein
MRVFTPRLGRLVARLVLVTLAAVGVALLLVTLVYGRTNAEERWDADVTQGDIWGQPPPAGQAEMSVWVYTPYAVPGGRVSLEVGVYGRSLDIAADRVTGTFGGRPFQEDGSGHGFGAVISTRGMRMKHDFVRFDLPVPAEAPPGDVLPLNVEAACSLALPSAEGKFRTELVTATASLPIPVRSAAEAAWRRAGDGACAAGALGLVCILVPWFLRAFRAEGASRAAESKVAAVLFLPAALGYGLVGYVAFARPALVAAGLPWGWVGPTLVGFWVLLPILVAIRVLRRERSGPRPPTPRPGLDFSKTGLPES